MSLMRQNNGYQKKGGKKRKNPLTPHTHTHTRKHKQEEDIATTLTKNKRKQKSFYEKKGKKK